MSEIENKLGILQKKISGKIYFDDLHLIAYSTDASVYRQKPLAVCIPLVYNDLLEIIKWSNTYQIPIIPRAAGTSLAGQVVGEGLIVDISKHFKQILEINPIEKWVKVQAGVVLDELNLFLKSYGLFFAPETSTSNRCTIAGMVGNNSCGTHALIYQSTREHVLELKTILSDGSEVVFGELTQAEFNKKCTLQTLEGQIYRKINQLIFDATLQNEIENEFPDKEIKRRNTGYAIDLLKFENKNSKTDKNEPTINLCKLLAGSEGTLAFTTEIKLNLEPLPPPEKAVIPIHLSNLQQAFEANLIALKHNPVAIELMDKPIMDCTKGNRDQAKNRFFVLGDPEALLIVEFAAHSKQEIFEKAKSLETEMRQNGFGYHFPLLFGNEVNKVWNLRKAGLGVLANLEGSAKAVALIEDIAVNVKKLPAFMQEMTKMLSKHGLSCVHYAHISTGELHLRPLIDLHTSHGQNLFRQVGLEAAQLVKKYRGSLSGEHGDGRLRGEFIPMMVGNAIYQVFREIKHTFDPKNILNPKKIIETPQINTHLRYEADKKLPAIQTFFNFDAENGILAAAEKCNGSADCRKSEIIGGMMCPSFKATTDEKNTTRARANLLREILTYSKTKNRFNNKQLYEVFDLCLMCKACKTECPSSVDVAKLKMEFLQHFYLSNPISLRSWLIANLPIFNQLGQISPFLFNFFAKKIMPFLGFTPKRSFPVLQKKLIPENFLKPIEEKVLTSKWHSKVCLFIDEFTQFNDTQIGIKVIMLLTHLGYQVVIPKHLNSARTYLSKGLLKKATKIINKNIEFLSPLISDDLPLIGIEPSAILGFRDEYLSLAFAKNKFAAEKLAKNALLFDEFIAKEIEKGKITKDFFTKKVQKITLHTHCHQKSLADSKSLITVLSLPENYEVTEIPSGCCGMAGAFGYEKEHYEISMKIGAQILFPSIRQTSDNVIIAASGTSCRCQIKDGTKRQALHPIEILYDAIV
jgi:FAD/FMN-containing dehydrogenase/Fe-S oxidoreductase